MKLRSKIITATLMLISLFAIAAFAGQGPRGQRGPGGPGGPGGFPFRALDLTDAQKEQIKAIHEDERTKTEAARKQTHEAHQALREATAKGQFDETKVRAIAATQAQAEIELTVSRTRAEAAVYKILTAEQQAKLDQFRAEHKPQHRGPGFGKPRQ